MLLPNQDEQPSSLYPELFHQIEELTFEGFFPPILLFECLIMLNFGYLITKTQKTWTLH